MNPTQEHHPADQSPLRIGFISARPLSDTNALSGMPHRMSQSLMHQGFKLIPLTEQTQHDNPGSLLRKAMSRVRAEQKRRTPVPIRKLIDDTIPNRTRAKLIRAVERRSERIQTLLDSLEKTAERPDAIFGCCISSSLYALETDLPIIYFSDATSFILRDTYPALINRGESHRQGLHHIERQSVDRTSSAIFASPVVRDSAIHDLGIPAQRTHVVPMGAHVTPEDPSTVSAPAEPPTRDDCQLLIVAADPVRKRVDLALEATQLLRDRGINATLHVVGPGTKACQNNPAAQTHGRLKLSDPTDRATHQRLLRDCHLQFLPSLGEAFGIAPIESAHFARPSIVSGAGGLPFVVQHNQTGLVIDTDAPANAWADAVESLIDDPDRYRSMSTAALKRARAELNWDAWGESVAKIIRDTVANHR